MELESTIAQRLDRGELVALEVRRHGLTGLFGKYRDDPSDGALDAVACRAVPPDEPSRLEA